jgi:hypothetical protein
MQDHGQFEIYTPDRGDPAIPNALYCRRVSGGDDWYAYQRTLDPATVKIMLTADGMIAAATRDASTLFPAGFRLLEIEHDGDPSALMRKVWTEDGAVDRPARIPTSCGPAQAKIVLWEMGLLDQVEAMVAAHPYRPVSLWYEAATVWELSHPYVTALGYELGLSGEQMLALFALAVTK